MIQSTRLRTINSDAAAKSGKYVLYWMQQAVRTRFNHALEFAIEQANDAALPLVVCFGLMDSYPEANARHYAFLLEGLRDVEINLAGRGIKFVVKHGDPPEVAVHYAKHARMVVCDRGYLRHQKLWRQIVAEGAGRMVVEVESDVVVPVDVTSDKREFAARTIRPKIHKHVADYLLPLPTRKLKHRSIGMRIVGNVDVGDPTAALAILKKLDQSVAPVEAFEGGENAAGELLKQFVDAKLDNYADGRNEPAIGKSSRMSAYLHFGHISALELALAVKKSQNGSQADRDSYLEELIVRRELAMNYVNFTTNYDTYEALPDWARRTLKHAANDPRATIYTRAELVAAKTHDPYWNAAQIEMNRTGFMHNYMRMYWGKKILEWTKSPEEAFDTTLRINNQLFLCGRDPISYASVAWIYGLHDRPWGPARKIFGTIRYMNAAGLKRKFDMDAYIKRVALL